MTDQERPSNQRHDINPTDMPSLEPTADVPPIHSDKLNDPAYWNDKFRGETAKVPVEHRDVQKPSIAKKVIAGIAGVAVLGGGVFVGVKTLAGGSDAAKPETRPTNSAPATPGETTPSPAETSSPEVATLPTPLAAEQYTDGDELIRAWNAELNQWHMGGATADTVKNAKWADPDAYVREIAEPLDDAFIDTHFVSDWEQRPQLAEKIAAIKNDHYVDLRAYLMTANPYVPNKEEVNIEPFKIVNKVTSTNVINSTEDTMEVSFDFAVETNSDKNEGERWIEDQNGWTGSNIVTFTLEDGTWKVSDIKYASE